MLSARGDPLYIGKAHSLKKRVATYAKPHRLPVRLQRMVAETAAMEFVTTHTEVEALLLESNLIKRLRPRYRSEEHTSELQSLMRISYAVFCLKKKKPKQK